jgi:hypothetical protein
MKKIGKWKINHFSFASSGLLILTAFLISAFSVFSVFAAESPAGASMETVLGIVKSRITIPEAYSEFDYSVQSGGDGKSIEIYDFSWRREDGEYNGYIYIHCDANGVILNYYGNESDYYGRDAETNLKFPAITPDDGGKTADSWFAKLNPDISGEFRRTDNNNGFYLSNNAFYSYVRQHNGIDFPNDTANVIVDLNTGELGSFRLNYSNVTGFPDARNKLSVEAARQAFSEKAGIKLVYMPIWKDGKEGAELKYTAADNEAKINALTGDVLKPEPFVYYSGMRADMARPESEKSNNGVVYGRDSFSEQELKLIDENLKLLSKDEAFNKVKSTKLLEIPKNAVCVGYNIYRINGGYIINLAITSSEKHDLDQKQIELMAASGDLNSYINVTLDAVTGDIQNFYRDGKSDGQKKINEEKAYELSRTAATTFLGGKASEFVETQKKGADIRPLSNVSSAGLSYVRTVNNIPYENNMCYVEYNLITGQLQNFSYSYSDIDFPGTQGIIDYEQALSGIFADRDYNLKYAVSKHISTDGGMSGVMPVETALIYDFSDDITIDAKTGKFDFEYKGGNSAMPQYADLEGHWAKDKIEKLASYGVYFEGNEFRPDDIMLQEDYIALLTILFGGNSVTVLRDSLTMKSVYGGYPVNFILNKDEIDRAAPVTRFDAVKYIIKAIGAENYAELPGIYSVPFTDVSEYEKGYAAIALGMKFIAPADSFNPNENLTRAEALCMVYNYLSR